MTKWLNYWFWMWKFFLPTDLLKCHEFSMLIIQWSFFGYIGFTPSVRLSFCLSVRGLFVNWGSPGWRLCVLTWILTQTSMSQLTVQQSYLLCWELLPDRNRKSTDLWYWELMSHPDPEVLPVGTLHSLEWFSVSRRIFVYSHHNTIVFFSKTSIRAWFVC